MNILLMKNWISLDATNNINNKRREIIFLHLNVLFSHHPKRILKLPEVP